MNEELVIDNGGYMYKHTHRAYISSWLDAPERCRHCVPLDEQVCAVLWTVNCAIYVLTFIES